MHHPWLNQLYHEYRRGYPEAVAGVKTLQRRVAIGCASPRDVSILKGLDQVHGSVQVYGDRFGQAPLQLSEPVSLDSGTLSTLLDLIAKARRPASVNQRTATSMTLAQRRQHGGGRAQISGLGPYVGRGGGGGHGGGGHGGGGHDGHGGGGFHRGGGFVPGGGWWTVPTYWPSDNCVVDAYGRVWCLTASGWVLQAT